MGDVTGNVAARGHSHAAVGLFEGQNVVKDLYPEGGDIPEGIFWTGLRPATPDGTPILGRAKYDNLFLNIGHGTLGWTMAAGCGRYVSDLIAGETPEISTEGLDITRYKR